MRATDLPAVLERAGLTVKVQDGWEARGRQMHGIDGLMWHHTASPPSASDDNMLRLLRDGRSDLPGPLYQLAVTRDAVWHVIASGRANHAGRGSWPGLSGNDDTVGVGAFHAGTSAERWDTGQLASLRVGSAAICAHYGIDPLHMLLGHKEWTDRKVDPYQLHMPNERRTVAALVEEYEMTPAQRKVLEDLTKALESVDSNGWFAAEAVKHLRNHPTSTAPSHDHDGRYASKGHGHTVPDHSHGGVE